MNNAVFLCFQCAGKHRTFGVQTSFVRSCGLDKWTRKQLKQMELGGNKAAKTYFDKNDLYAAGLHNYALPLAVKYRTDLVKRVLFLGFLLRLRLPFKKVDSRPRLVLLPHLPHSTLWLLKNSKAPTTPSSPPSPNDPLQLQLQRQRQLQPQF